MLKKKLLLLALPVVTALSLHASDPFNDPFFNDPFGDDIFKEMMQMQKNMDKMFERMQHRMNQRSSGLVSPLGTYKMAVQNQLVDKGDHYELVTSIPESKENHIDINTANGMMNITAKIVQKKEEKNQYGVSQSRSVRMYQQSTSLPVDADESVISTAYKNGKLLISIGKKKSAVKTNKVGTVPTLMKREKTNAKVVVPKPNYEKKEVKKQGSSEITEEKKEQKNTPQKEGNVTIKPMKIKSDIPTMS
ncbi:hypothetical protein YH65_05340 [Sulfurovum lithotrophicum]|uniref:SHSP domain-containing protein n=1 Tax=Sulfurovum lithotrophicum TaxID=206403 RepID=A0A7U4M181_9BACT|nr:Hsp20/alpha crystallin family protein [Sulfurovum lithotrophicum]AKF24874.1 hypothetical protein YH65_05340 [Sulfurovum lithotrophicum]